MLFIGTERRSLFIPLFIERIDKGVAPSGCGGGLRFVQAITALNVIRVEMYYLII